MSRGGGWGRGWGMTMGRAGAVSGALTVTGALVLVELGVLILVLGAGAETAALKAE